MNIFFNDFSRNACSNTTTIYIVCNNTSNANYSSITNCNTF